jgi:Uma2 family endonuclease
MANLLIGASDVRKDTEVREFYIAERPVSFEHYLDIAGDNDYAELVNGVIVERMAAQLDHEWILTWLLALLKTVAEKRKLGIVLGSRTAVKINEFGGRLPDIVFVREERRDILQEKAIVEAPDLVIELISPGDRPSDVIALETDYRQRGVTEIAFLDRKKQALRLLRKRAADYEESIVTAGDFAFETLPAITLKAEWLLGDARPELFDAAVSLLKED